LQLGGGYLFGLGVGFVTDSLGSTLGATAAFLVGRTVSNPFALAEKRLCTPEYFGFYAIVYNMTFKQHPSI